MINGTITGKHIMTHPFTLIGLFGFIGYCRLLVRCVDSRPSCFMDFLMR